MSSNDMPELGSKISLISKADIRYEGKLFTVDPQDCTIALANVRSFGTEDRVTDHPVPAQSQVYDYILFRATDIKDISVIPTPPVIFDPAIVQLSAPPTLNAGGGSRFQSGFQHPVLGQFGGSNEPRPIGSGSQPSFNPMQPSSLLNPIQQRPRQTSESQRLNGSVADLIGGNNSGGGQGGGGVSRSSTPGLGRRMSSEQNNQSGNQRQPGTGGMRFGGMNQGPGDQQRNRNNSQSNSSNHEERNYNNRQQGGQQNKGRDQQQPSQPQPQRYNRNMDNGFGRDNRNNDGPMGYDYNNRGNNDHQRNNMQQRRYQNNGGQQRNMQQGGNKDRLPEQGMRNHQQGGGGGGGQGGGPGRRNQGAGGWMGGRQGGGNHPGGRQGPGRQGGNQQRRSYNNTGQPKQSQPPKQPLKFDSDYDFDKANTEFEELRLTLAQVKIADNGGGAVNNAVGGAGGGGGGGAVNNGDDKKDDSGNETGVGECVDAQQDDEAAAYDKTKSFFDNISCEAVERSKGRSQRVDWRKELKLNTETFGVSMSRRFYVPRGGRAYYNRGGSWNYKPRQQQNNMITAKV